MNCTYLVHGWRNLLVVLLTHGLWMINHTCLGILLETHIDLDDDYKLCYVWLMHILVILCIWLRVVLVIDLGE
jgi:hypothetical protein